MDDDDWDLQAVVRGCGGGAAATTNPSFSLADEINSFDFLIDDDHNNINVPGPFHGLQEAYRELGDDAPTPPPPPAVSLPGRDHGVPDPAPHEIRQILKSAPDIQIMNNKMRSQENIPFGYNNGIGSSSSLSLVSSPSHNLQALANRQRRRKNQQMKVVRQMTQEQLSADSWAWRKYGQKPIKGSPYPRNYYRCSTAKGCAAKKQVERSPNDPGLFVVSYTGEHTHPRPTHRSSLAGSTRTKSSTTSVVARINNNDHDLFSQNKGLNIPSLTTTTTKETAENDSVQELAEDEEDDDEGNTIFTIPNHNDDDMFKGFDDHSTCDGNMFPVTSPPQTSTGSLIYKM